jgi:hypothetical protein
MNVTIARIVMGHFLKGNKRAIRNVAKWFNMKPEDLLQQANLMIGKKSPITTYKTLQGGYKTIKNK